MIDGPYTFWTDAKHAMRERADEQGAAIIVATVGAYHVIAGETIDECEAQTDRTTLDSEVVR